MTFDNCFSLSILHEALSVVGRLGGWSDYVAGGYGPASQKNRAQKPGPKTMHDGLVRFDAIGRGWSIA
jgi:hypothetical protein